MVPKPTRLGFFSIETSQAVTKVDRSHWGRSYRRPLAALVCGQSAIGVKCSSVFR
jgi:hypothetical protein